MQIKEFEVTEYSPEIQNKIEQAIVFLINKITDRCYNKKPVILHSLRVGLKLMEQKKEPNIVIAGFLHDLLEDTDCEYVNIEDEYGAKVASLVLACSINKEIKGYRERWAKLVSNLKKEGKGAMIIKLIDQADNLPYYYLINDENKKQEVIWKHKFFIDECSKELKEYQIFEEYRRKVSKIMENAII